MSCRRRSGYRRLLHRPTAYWGILKWPSLGEFGWPPGDLRIPRFDVNPAMKIESNGTYPQLHGTFIHIRSLSPHILHSRETLTNLGNVHEEIP